jgi:type IV pilus assembly protein PilP
MKNRIGSRAIGPALAVFVGLAACGSPPPPPRRAAPAPAPAKIIDDDSDKPKEPVNIYVYSPIGKRDPFTNVLSNKDLTPVRVGGHKPGPLEKFGLDSLRLALTITGTANPLAMVEDPDGRGWPVRLGDFIGTNSGKVTGIHRDEVIVTETITDHSTGRVYPQNVKLKVPVDPSEQNDLSMLKQGEELRASGGQ